MHSKNASTSFACFAASACEENLWDIFFLIFLRAELKRAYNFEYGLQLSLIYHSDIN
jgi:hypothetical protein